MFYYYNEYSLLDRPDILQFTFYPRKEARRGPPNSTDYFIPVGDEVSICCRFYVHSHSSPSILFFHGNGEIASDYDDVAPIYNQRNINLFVTDYRGYGLSGGTPTFTNMVLLMPAAFLKPSWTSCAERITPVISL